MDLSPRYEARDEARSETAGVIGTVRYPRLVPKNDECAKEL